MSQPRSRRLLGASLVFTLLLLVPAFSSALPWGTAGPVSQPARISESDLLDRFLALLSSLWDARDKNGSQLDPHGNSGEGRGQLDPNGSPTENGSQLDPSGTPVENGSQLDPDGVH